jgi:hypothetical protein
MQNLQQKEEALVNLAPAIVALVIDPYRVVINKGAQDGIKFAQRFTVYELSAEDVVDPTTMESLGRLETIKGTGTVVHIQDKMAILEAINENPFAALLISTPKTPFKNPKVGDRRDLFDL